MQLADLDPRALVAIAVFTACATGLLMVLLFAPRRDCFFFRWHPETRFLALLVAPALLFVWPVVLFSWFIRSRGVDLDELDFYDD
ncbi:MAG: hypothetical protein ACLGSD_17355 [Acidobacteriota bacterium]